MKTFDVFLKERLAQINVSSEKTFDVFIKDRLTQLDITISTLISREGFSFFDKMVIDCAIKELEFLKQISMQSGMEIDVKLDELYTTVSALAKTAMVLDADLKLSQEDFVTVGATLELFTPPLGIVNGLVTDFQNSQVITFSLDNFDTGTSLGKGISNLILSTSKVETDKVSYLRPEIEMTLMTDMDFSGKKVLHPTPLDMEISVSRIGLFYSTLIEGGTSIFIGTFPINDVVHNKIVSGSGFRNTFDFSASNALGSEEYLSGSSEIELLTSVVLLLNEIFRPEVSDLQLSCKASVGLYRRRLLEEMDDVALSDLDGNTLRELDYIYLG